MFHLIHLFLLIISFFCSQRGFIKPAVLQSSLKSTKEELERKLGLSVFLTVTDPCAAAPCPVDKNCAAVVKPVSNKDPSGSVGLKTMFTRGYACLCLDGSMGRWISFSLPFLLFCHVSDWSVFGRRLVLLRE